MDSTHTQWTSTLYLGVARGLNSYLTMRLGGCHWCMENGPAYAASQFMQTKNFLGDSCPLVFSVDHARSPLVSLESHSFPVSQSICRVLILEKILLMP